MNPSERDQGRARRIHLHFRQGGAALPFRRPDAAEIDRAATAPCFLSYGAMFSEAIGQTDEGCDLDFLQTQTPIAEPERH
jgi:hypothetical protein